MLVSDKFYLELQNKIKLNIVFRVFWEIGCYWMVLYYPVAFLWVVNNLPPENGNMLIIRFGLVVLLSVYILPHLIARIHHRSRPFVKFGFTPPGVYRLFSNLNNKENSLPSEHSSSSLALSLLLFAYNPTLGVIGFIVTLWIANGRIIFGFHYPSDVLAGWVTGLISVALVMVLRF